MLLASDMRGILDTLNYEHFRIINSEGVCAAEFDGAKKANKCLNGDAIIWDGEQCKLLQRDEHPIISGTLEISSKTTYGVTSRGIPIYLFVPFRKDYPPFIVGCSEKDKSKNKICTIKFSEWTGQFPRGNLVKVIGNSGSIDAEVQGLINSLCPWPSLKGPFDLKPHNTENRHRLTGCTFNIDPSGCRDIDDVVTIESVEPHVWRITITISDVAAYIEELGAVDIMASTIGQTLYHNGRAVKPMLPVEISEDACSLHEGKEHLGVSLIILWNEKEIISKEWKETVFVNNKSWTYDDFMSSSSDEKSVLQMFTSYIEKRDLNDSHEWIEVLMKLYNMETGKLLKNAGVGILRRHTAPNMERLKKYSEWDSGLAVLANSAAEYCEANDENTVHYGLESAAYCHATSPIRRYADLMNQRILKELIKEGGEEEHKLLMVTVDINELNRRAKLYKGFERDVIYMTALQETKSFTGRILDIKEEDGKYKLRIFIPDWKRTISCRYKKIGEDEICSQDESENFQIKEGSFVDITCSIQPNTRRWKDRIVTRIKKIY